MKLFLFIMVSAVSFPMIAMEKEEEPQSTIFPTVTTRENSLETLPFILQKLEDINNKMDRIELKVMAIKQQVRYGFEYAKQSDQDFGIFIKQKVQEQFEIKLIEKKPSMAEEEQIQLAVALSLQEQVPMETEEKQGSD